MIAVALSTANAAPAAEIPVSGFDSPALAQAMAQAKSGDTVRLPAGTVTITEPIKPRSGLRLLGAGRDQTIVRFGGSRPGSMISLRDCEDVEVADLTLDGQAQTNITAGISAGNARRLKLHHLTVRNIGSGASAAHGVHFSGTAPSGVRGVSDSEVSDCLIENIAPEAKFGCGIRFAWGSSSNRALRNVIRTTGRGGIFGDNGSTDLVIRENTVTGSGGEGLGIEVWEHCDRAVIEDNRVDHWLSNGGSDYCAVRRNVVSDTSGTVKFIGIEGIGRHCVYTDNTVDDGQQIGFSVSNTYTNNDGFWGYNKVANCVLWGAQFQGESTGIARHYFYRCAFVHNTAARGAPRYPNDAGHGFRFNGNVRDCVFEQCEFSDNDRIGLQLFDPGIDGLTFLRCTIAGNRGSAMAGPRDYNELEWIDCTITSNKSDLVRPAKPFAHPAPLAAFDLPTAARAGEPVRFISTSRAAQGNISAVLWDFNDGPPSSAPDAKHTYARPGDYRVTLVVWDEAGRGARAEKQLRVAP